MENFSGATRVGKTIAVTTSSAAHLLGADVTEGMSASDMSVDNRGDADAYIRLGDSTASVTVATGLRIPAGAIVTLAKPGASHIAVIGDGATSIAVHLGRGI